MVDKLAEGDKKLTLNFIPDGKSKNMSKIESKLDQKAIAGGNTVKGADQNKDKKKKGGETAAGADEEVKLSKKELNKLKKKE